MKNARLTVTRLPGALTICVRDHEPAMPKLHFTEADAEHGRGLLVVAAVSDDCGCSPVKGGKDVWASFLTTAGGMSGSQPARRAS